jgi:hypothetical protein
MKSYGIINFWGLFFSMMFLSGTADAQSQINALTATPYSQPISCNGESDGKAWLTIDGGTPPYSVNWSNGAIGDSLSSLSAGYYSATVSDSTQDTLVFSFFFLMPNLLQVTAAITPDIVPASSGEIALTVAGGTPPYFFNWATGSTAQTADSLSTGPYAVTVTDSHGCQHISTYFVNGQSTGTGGIQTQWTYQNPNCPNPCNGSVNVTPNLNSFPLTYTWSNGESTEDLTDVCAGTYTLTISHPGSNPSNLSTPWNYTNTGLNHSVFISPNSLYINGVPATEAYQIGAFFLDDSQLECGGVVLYDSISTAIPVWGDDVFTPNKDGFANGEAFAWHIIYNAVSYPLDVVYSPNGDPGIFGSNFLSEIISMHLNIAYSDTLSVELDIQDPLTLNYAIQACDPISGSGGAIDMSVSGGNPPYNFVWSNGASSEDISNLSYGNYHLTHFQPSLFQHRSLVLVNVTDLYFCKLLPEQIQ